jgi:regulator of protease activity HflC (stomatin/prohibitin superfamily)
MSNDRLADVGIIMLDRALGIGGRVEAWYQRLGMLPLHWDHGRFPGLIWRGIDPWGYDAKDPARLARTTTIGVQEFERAVVLQNGAFTGVMEPGVWEIDKNHRLRSAVQVVWVNTRQVELRGGVGKVINKEGITLGAHGMIYAQIADPQPFVLQVVGGLLTYSAQELENWLKPSVASAMRAELAGYSVMGLMGERDAFQESASRRLAAVLEAWGIGLRSIEVEEFNLPEEYRRAAAAATVTTLERNAAVIAAQAEAEITRIGASAEADKRLLEGAAQAQYFGMLQAQGIDPIKIEWIRALKEYADNPSGGMGDLYKPQLFMQAGQILADPQIPAAVKQDVRGMLPGPQMPQITDPSRSVVQYPGVHVENAPPAQPDAPVTPPTAAQFFATPQPAVTPMAAAEQPTAEAQLLTRERVQQMLDNLDMQLADGKLSEDRYDQLYARWEKRLQQFDS